jgi:hypothetical protein
VPRHPRALPRPTNVGEISFSFFYHYITLISDIFVNFFSSFFSFPFLSSFLRVMLGTA